MVRTIGSGQAASEAAVARFAAAVGGLPSGRGFGNFTTWVVEGCRTTQPLELLMASGVAPPTSPWPSLVSIQARLVVDGTPVLAGAPALLGQDGEATQLLASPNFD
jgi:hypothetical protein